MLVTAHYEKLLREHRAELQRRLEEIEQELEKPSDPDDEERATEREGDEVLEGVGQAGLNEIRAIDAALERIENGTYGICVDCGGEISEARLNAVPYAIKCRDCAQ